MPNVPFFFACVCMDTVYLCGVHAYTGVYRPEVEVSPSRFLVYSDKLTLNLELTGLVTSAGWPVGTRDAAVSTGTHPLYPALCFSNGCWGWL